MHYLKLNSTTKDLVIFIPDEDTVTLSNALQALGKNARTAPLTEFSMFCTALRGGVKELVSIKFTTIWWRNDVWDMRVFMTDSVGEGYKTLKVYKKKAQLLPMSGSSFFSYTIPM